MYAQPKGCCHILAGYHLYIETLATPLRGCSDPYSGQQLQDGAVYKRNRGSHGQVFIAISPLPQNGSPVQGNVMCYPTSGHQTLIGSLYLLVVLAETLPARMKCCPFQVGRYLIYTGFSDDFCFWQAKRPAVAVAKSTLGKGNPYFGGCE